MKFTTEEIEEQQILTAIKVVFENRKMLTNYEVADLLRLSKSLNERVKENDKE